MSDPSTTDSVPPAPPLPSERPAAVGESTVVGQSNAPAALEDREAERYHRASRKTVPEVEPEKVASSQSEVAISGSGSVADTRPSGRPGAGKSPFSSAALRAAASVADDPGDVFSVVEQAIEHPERGVRFRRKPDLLSQLPLAAAWLAFGSAGVALMFLDNARPRRYGLDRFFNERRTPDVLGSLQTAQALTGLALAIAILGLVINSRRMRRASDHYNRGLLLCAGLSALGLAWFAYRTW